MKSPFKKLADGRLLCEWDASHGIFSETEAQRLFETVKGEVFPLFSGLGSLPNRNVLCRMVDAQQMADLRQDPAAETPTLVPMALARSRRNDDQAWQHEIYVVSGLNQLHLMATLAHEYTHVWLRENVPPGRQLEKSTLEGFCELVAYQIMNRRGEESQKQAILTNAYTRGQVQTFLRAQDAYQFFRIVNWIKHGVDPSLASSDLARVLELRKQPGQQDTVLTTLQPVATPVPEQLTLKGVSGKPGHRFALINDQTLQQHEAASIRVGDSRVNVRCLEIGERFARIEVEGQSHPIELRLDSPR